MMTIMNQIAVIPPTPMSFPNDPFFIYLLPLQTSNILLACYI